MTDGWDEVPILSRNAPNKNEQRALGGWFKVHGPSPAEYILIQTEVPLGIQRAANALNHSIDTDLSKSELVAGDRLPRGFHTEKDISNMSGFGIAAATTRADVIFLKRSEIIVVEIKTANEPIDGSGDAHGAFGQLLMYLDRFEEDYPTLTNTHELRGFVLAEDSSIDPVLIEPSFQKRDLGLFDPLRGGFLIRPSWIDQ